MKIERRNDLRRYTVIESKIHELVCLIEEIDAHVALTEVQELLIKAQDKFADYVDEKIQTECWMIEDINGLVCLGERDESIKSNQVNYYGHTVLHFCNEKAYRFLTKSDAVIFIRRQGLSEPYDRGGLKINLHLFDKVQKSC